MQRFDLNTLSQFVVLARHLNFRRAAAELAIPTSTLSERIRDLEESLGKRLLNRTTRSCALTDEGAQLLARIADAVTVLDDAAGEVRSGGDRLSGRLRINGPRPAIELRLMPLALTFLNAHPEIRLEIVSQNDLVDVVAAGFDAGVRYDETLAQDMIAVRLGPEQRMIIAASPAYLARRGRPLVPADLAEHDCIGHVFAGGNVLPWSLEHGDTAVDVTPQGRLVVNEIEPALAAARAGTGLVHTFDDYVAADLASGTLEAVLDDWTQPFPGPSLYFPQRHLMPAALRAFIDHIRAATRRP